MNKFNKEKEWKMKNFSKYLKAFAVTGAILVTPITVSASNDVGTQNGIEVQKTRITKQQREDLKFMFQEEKLARDVYIALGEMWEHRTFLNIQKAEQSHMNAVKRLMKKYHVRIPVDEDAIGEFADKDLQELYNELIDKGSESLEEALKVGVLIEETDIDDLKERRKGAPRDIRRVYNRLLRGSYKHLDAFNNALAGGGKGGGGKGRGGR
jgi:hypothetical protein